MELQKEGQRKEALEDRVSYLNNDQGMEAEIRRHFDVALPGEQVVVIVGEEEATTALSKKVDEDKEDGFWSRWWPW